MIAPNLELAQHDAAERELFRSALAALAEHALDPDEAGAWITDAVEQRLSALAGPDMASPDPGNGRGVS